MAGPLHLRIVFPGTRADFTVMHGTSGQRGARRSVPLDADWNAFDAGEPPWTRRFTRSQPTICRCSSLRRRNRRVDGGHGVRSAGSPLSAFGVLFLTLHTLPERMAHKSHKLQFEIVAVLGLHGAVHPYAHFLGGRPAAGADRFSRFRRMARQDRGIGREDRRINGRGEFDRPTRRTEDGGANRPGRRRQHQASRWRPRRRDELAPASRRS